MKLKTKLKMVNHKITALLAFAMLNSPTEALTLRNTTFVGGHSGITKEEILSWPGVEDTKARFLKEHLHKNLPSTPAEPSKPAQTPAGIFDTRREFNAREKIPTKEEIEAGMENYASWLASLQGVAADGRQLDPRCLGAKDHEERACLTRAGEKAWKLHILYTHAYRPEMRTLFNGLHLHRKLDLDTGKLSAFFKLPLRHEQVARIEELDNSNLPQLHKVMERVLPSFKAALKQTRRDWSGATLIYKDEKKAKDVMKRHRNGQLLHEYMRWWILRRAFPDLGFPMWAADVDDIWHNHLSVDTLAYERDSGIFFPPGFGGEREEPVIAYLGEKHGVRAQRIGTLAGFLHHGPYWTRKTANDADAANTSYVENARRWRPMKYFYQKAFGEAINWPDADAEAGHTLKAFAKAQAPETFLAASSASVH